jgi:hypothetical protein
MRRHWMLGALALLSFTTLKPIGLYAHHNQFQGFDPEREQVVTGTVERFAWQNPHAYIYLASREGNEARSWRIETLSISFMRQLGWGPDTIRAGDNVTMTINPSRTEGRATGWLIDIAVEGRDVPSLTDEKRIGAIISGESSRTDARTSSVSGTWITQTGPAELWKWIDDPSQLELTEAGRRAVDSYDPADASSRASCEPRPIPRIMIAGDRKSIGLLDDVGFEPSTTRPIAWLTLTRALPRAGRCTATHWLDGRTGSLSRLPTLRKTQLASRTGCLRATRNIWSNGLRWRTLDNR